MSIDYEDLAERGFNVLAKDGLTLVYPGKERDNRDWDGLREYRSIILDEDGCVVSRGLNKFFNWEEDPIDTMELRQALIRNDDVYFTEKIDGCLLIHSVINGEVVMRTRGTFDGGDMKDALWDTARKKAFSLLDPSLRPDYSLLFEFVHPDYRIVMDYKEPDLYFIGYIHNKSGKLSTVAETQLMATQYGFKLVPIHELPTDPQELLDIINTMDIEGIVARCNHSQTLVKMKNADYLARHRLRFAMTPKFLREQIETQNLSTMEEFDVWLKAQGGDWELLQGITETVEAILRAKVEALYVFKDLERDVDRLLFIDFPVARKDFAINFALKLPNHLKSAAFSLYDDNEKQALKQIEKHLLDELMETL